jgi:putative transposase
MTFFHNKFRIESARLRGWNYSSDGYYFLTICTYRFECIMGEIVDDKMLLSNQGLIAKEELLHSFEIRNELSCIIYVIMPNHIHMIVRLKNTDPNNHGKSEESGLQPKSISSFTGGFKSSVTARINNLRNAKGAKVWHPRFHDHLIRNNHDFQMIYKYILNNPVAWKKDRFLRFKITTPGFG